MSRAGFPRRRLRLIAILLSLMAIGMAGCATFDREGHAEALARPAGLQREEVAAGPFVLTAWTRITRPDRPLRVYIEGDGFAWVSRSEPSRDPTPRQATGLALAATDPAPNVVYLARPCQFTAMVKNPLCGIPYWTGQRFASEVVDAMNQAVDRVAARAPGQLIDLVGYSGGGALAVLVASHRSDVATIRTVAGNLDIEFVNRLHGVSAMPLSENPINAATRVATIPQIHFSGSDDVVVPPVVARRFVEMAGARCVQALTVPGLPHDGDWSHQWPALLVVTPSCAH